MLNDAAVSQFKKVYLAHGYTYTDHSRDRQADQYYANLGSQQQIDDYFSICYTTFDTYII